MEHPSPDSSPGTHSESLQQVNMNQWPVKSDVTPTAIPPELLSKIFLICVDLSQDDLPIYSFWDDFTCGDHLPWIAIAQVCRYWRSVALGCGELWRNLIFSSREATHEMLRRSKGVTLVVKAKDFSDDPTICDNVRMVISEIGRVSVLHLCFRRDLLQPLVDDFSVPAPKLESLQLHVTDNAYFKNPFYVPDSMFAGHTPSLRLLGLSSFKFSWQLPHFLSGLTQLRLVLPLTVAQVLSLLHEMPRLDTLILTRVLHTCLPEYASRNIASPKLFLPHLRVLILAGTMDACTHLLKQIEYPSTTIPTFTFQIPCVEKNRDLLSDFLRSTQSAIRYAGGNHVIRTLEVGRTPERNWILRCWVAHRSSALLVSSQEPPQLSVTLMGGINAIPLIELIRIAVVTLPLAEVQTLYMLGPLSEIDWPEFFQHLPNIHTLHLPKNCPFGLIKVLAGIEEKMVESTGPLTLPLLRSLWLIGVNFSSSDTRKQILLSCLQQRSQVGLAIQDIHVKNCWNIYEQDVERMKEHVRNVEWISDGRFKP